MFSMIMYYLGLGERRIRFNFAVSALGKGPSDDVMIENRTHVTVEYRNMKVCCIPKMKM